MSWWFPTDGESQYQYKQKHVVTLLTLVVLRQELSFFTDKTQALQGDLKQRGEEGCDENNPLLGQCLLHFLKALSEKLAIYNSKVTQRG